MTPNICISVGGISFLFIVLSIINQHWAWTIGSGIVFLVALSVFLWDLFAYRRHLGKQDQPYRFEDLD